MTDTIIAFRPPRDGKQYDCQCARCGSSCHFVECTDCGGDGFSGHDCGDDCCCCEYPDDNVPCDACRGYGGWWTCLSSPEWCKNNPLPGREAIAWGQIEWFEDSDCC